MLQGIPARTAQGAELLVLHSEEGYVNVLVQSHPGDAPVTAVNHSMAAQITAATPKNNFPCVIGSIVSQRTPRLQSSVENSVSKGNEPHQDSNEAFGKKALTTSPQRRSEV